MARPLAAAAIDAKPGNHDGGILVASLRPCTNQDEPSMATDTLRIGIIGAGANTRSRHIPGLRMQNSVEIVGVANRSAASSEKAAKELDIPKAYGDWTEIIADKTIDAGCIG